jgi:integrative and conjugative element protein (TIGR02256 family)
MKTDIIVRFEMWMYQFIIDELNNWFPRETGGILIGHWLNEKEVSITQIVGPGCNAVHLSSSFIPDNEYHIKEIARYYGQSEGKETYLGDWHTHPNQPSYLSTLDRKTLRKIANFKPARQKRPLMLVMGTHPWGMKVFVYQNTGVFNQKSVRECILIPY